MLFTGIKTIVVHSSTSIMLIITTKQLNIILVTKIVNFDTFKDIPFMQWFSVITYNQDQITIISS